MKVKDALKVSLFFLFLIGFGISVFADEAEDCIYQNDKIRIVVGYHEDGSLNKVSTSIVSESVDLEGYSLDYTFIASQVNEKYQQGEKFFCPLYANGYHDDEKKILWFQLSDETDIGAYMVINRAKKPTPSSTPGQDPGSSEPGGSTPGSPSSGGQPQQHFHLGDDPKIRDLCSSSGFLTILGMVLNIITILKIAVPLILIGMLTIQIYPLINNPAEVKQVIEKSKKKIIAAVLIFFVPTIMNVILGALGDSTTVSACYAHAKDKEYIAARKQAEKDFFSGNGTSSAPQPTKSHSFEAKLSGNGGVFDDGKTYASYMCEDNPCVPGIQPKRDGYTFDGWVLRNSSESCSSSIDITIHGVQNSIFDACWK